MLTPPPLPALWVVAADEDLLEVIVGTVPVAVDVMAGEGTAAFKAPKSTSTPVDDELDEVVAGAPAVADVVAFVVVVVVVRLAVATFVFDVFDILLPWAVLLTAAEVEVAVKEAAAEDEVVELALLLLLLLTFSLIFELVLVLLLVLVFFNLALAADATPLSNSSFAVVAGVGASVVV